MIISAGYLKQFIDTDVSDEVLEARLQALELSIRKYTNNNFQKRAFRTKGTFEDGKLYCYTALFKAGDTIQVTESNFNEGLYVVNEVDNDVITIEGSLDETDVLVTKVEYPLDVVMGVVEIMRWKLKNEAENSNDTSKMRVQSESLSRHSVTYAADATETDIDVEFGVPKKYLSFLKLHKKARF